MPVRPSRSRLPVLFLLAAAIAACSSDSLTGPMGFSLRSLATSAANGPIVFQTFQTIEAVDPDGSNQHTILDPGGDNPEVSPDGTRIAFDNFISGGGAWEIFVMDADGSNVTNVTNHDDFDTDPTWSPDRTKIAFRREEAGGNNGRIWVMNADGSGQTQITDSEDPLHNDFAPSWSPDGTRIAFHRTEDGVLGVFENVWVVLANGGGEGRLSNFEESTGRAYEPDWSPDGTRIAYRCLFTDKEPGPTGIDTDICVSDANGSNQTPVLATDAYELEPSWSPDGAKIAYVRDETFGPATVWVANADGTGQAQVSEGIGNHPSWGPGESAADPQCDDGADNDSDGKADFPDDPGCANGDDESESPDPPPPPQCSDEADNDSDGKADFPDDPGCTDANDDDETDPPPPGEDPTLEGVGASIDALDLSARLKARLTRTLDSAIWSVENGHPRRAAVFLGGLALRIRILWLTGQLPSDEAGALIAQVRAAIAELLE